MHDGSLVYDAGKLLPVPEDDEADIPNYLRHTEASARQAGLSYMKDAAPPVTESAYRSSIEDDETVETSTPWGATTGHAAIEPLQPDQDAEPQLTCTQCDTIDIADASGADISLRTRSRLHNVDFYTTPASSCFVPIKLQSRLLNTALRLAKETVWSALRTHWPKIQRSKYLEGPQEFKFGREELYGAFGDIEYPTEANQMCGAPRSSVINALLDVVYLRNAVCHPMQRGSKDIDWLLQQAQSLAVVLLDESRAFKIRKLRDTLQAETTRAHAEIETLEPLAALPYTKKPWALPHQRLFSDVAHAVSRNLPSKDRYPPAVVRAAMVWNLKYARPGDMDPLYLANVERAKSYVRDVGHGRRGSASGDLGSLDEKKPESVEATTSGVEIGVDAWPTAVAPVTSSDGW